ncbi:Ribokinase-like protein [Ceraceosorus guamensis]|uniref:pyridoxal kinase n=1 Tax=Ceraceosorus guamensis TaxID=1522189 RepID=A0A316VYE4_9BASI|nr:Ribokinase-like protein [Ceraceosorus guamensis]PWN42510.1 Ribokinase-like protein [Ceraceosorus guamensis]
MQSAEPGRLLSIQSHVCSGFVGNRSATFPLQLLGWDIDIVNTTQLSNHTGYGRWGGMRLDDAHLRNVFAGLEANGLNRWVRLLTGYTPSPAALAAVSGFIRRTRTANPDLIYLLDPVLGDSDRGFYVDKECLPLYRELLPMSNIVCPNSFEAQQLAGVDITDRSSLLSAFAILHAKYHVEHVIITSLEPLPADLGITATLPDGSRAMVQAGSSFSVPQSSNVPKLDEVTEQINPWLIAFPEVEGHFVGVGDLFSALVLGRFEREHRSAPGSASVTPLAGAAEQAIASVQGVLQRTQKYMANLTKESESSAGSKGMKNAADDQDASLVGPTSSAATPEDLASAHLQVEYARARELRVVQSREELERPNVKWKASWLKR